MAVIYTAGSNYGVKNILEILDSSFNSSEFIALPELELLSPATYQTDYFFLLIYKGNIYNISYLRENMYSLVSESEYLKERLQEYSPKFFNISVDSLVVLDEDRKIMGLSENVRREHKNINILTPEQLVEYLQNAKSNTEIQSNELISKAILAFAVFYFRLDNSRDSSEDDEISHYSYVKYYSSRDRSLLPNQEVTFTPRYLTQTLAPYLLGIEKISEIIDITRNNPVRSTRIWQIIKEENSSFKLSVEGVAETIHILRDLAVPWQRRHQQEMTTLAEKERGIEIESQRVVDRKFLAEKEKLRLDLEKGREQLALDILQRIGADINEDEIKDKVLQLLDPLKIITDTELTPRYLGKK